MVLNLSTYTLNTVTLGVESIPTAVAFKRIKHPVLSLGEACGTSSKTSGGCVWIPITLTNQEGIEIASTCNEIGYDSELLEFLEECELGPAGEDADKSITICEIISDGLAKVCVGDNPNPIPDGEVAYAIFQLSLNSCGDVYDLSNDPSAKDPGENDVPVDGKDGTITSTRCGDFSCDFSVIINEIIKMVRMYLGQDPVDPIADPNCDGVVSINEVILAVNCYLETDACPCEI